MKNILFDFNALTKAEKPIARAFAKAGATVVQQSVDPSVRRTSGVTYRELTLTFADSQKLLLRIKQTGDVYQVLLNGKLVPLKAQDDQMQAVAELAAAMNAGRTKFQARLVKAAAKIPAALRTAAPKLEQVLIEKRDALKEAIVAVREEIAALQAS